MRNVQDSVGSVGEPGFVPAAAARARWAKAKAEGKKALLEDQD
jgi:hypothetical protein